MMFHCRANDDTARWELPDNSSHGVMRFVCRLRSQNSSKLLAVHIFLVACLVLILVREASAGEQEGNAGQAPGQVHWLHFDIPAQSLVSALDAYSTVTGLEVFYDGALALGRRSAGVSGIFPPDEALRTLLQGTDFVPRAIGPYSITIAPASHAAVNSAGPIVPPEGGYERYFAALQTSLRQALCRNSQTRPGSYRLVIKFWLAPSGAILRPELIGSTGDLDRDRAFAAALPLVKADGPAPAGMPQPVTMVVLPRSSGEAEECLSRHARDQDN